MPAQANVKTEISALVARKDLAALKKYLEPWLPVDLAPLIADLPV
jgi:magnesium transporter